MQTRGNFELAVRFILTCQEMQSINVNCFSTSSSRCFGCKLNLGWIQITKCPIRFLWLVTTHNKMQTNNALIPKNIGAVSYWTIIQIMLRRKIVSESLTFHIFVVFLNKNVSVSICTFIRTYVFIKAVTFIYSLISSL